MACEMYDWQTAIDFLTIDEVIDCAFERASETGQTPYGEFAIVPVSAKYVLCVHRSHTKRSAEFMTHDEAAAFRKEFWKSFLNVFRL